MGMRKKELRVVGKPSADKNCELLDSPIPPKPQSSSDETDLIVPRFIALRTPKNPTGVLDVCAVRENDDREVCGNDEGGKVGNDEGEKLPGNDIFIEEPEDDKEERSPKTDSESGRSMVEMLGVLAIMGVLAIGGIAGYRYAMIKHRVNDLYQELNRRAVMYQAYIVSGATGNLSNSELGSKTVLDGFPVSGYYDSDAGLLKMTVSDIPYDICVEMIRNVPGKWQNGISVGGQKPTGDIERFCKENAKAQ